MLRDEIKTITIIYTNESTCHVAQEGGNSKIIDKKVGCEGWL
jgi:hypothetical protein